MLIGSDKTMFTPYLCLILNISNIMVNINLAKKWFINNTRPILYISIYVQCMMTFITSIRIVQHLWVHIYLTWLSVMFVSIGWHVTQYVVHCQINLVTIKGTFSFRNGYTKATRPKLEILENSEIMICANFQKICMSCIWV